jgi:NTE family protein
MASEAYKHSYNVLNRAYEISFGNQSTLKFSQCDVLVSPEELKKYGIFDLRTIEPIFNIGYEATQKVLQN